jgi:oxygen-dependent protoporphyrinogen oxidase
VPVNVAIIGGGISGLATAYYLGRYGVPSVIVERSSRLGGLIGTDVVQGCRLEAGPDSYLAAKPAVTDLSKELGDLSREVIESNDGARRVFIVRDGKLMALPRGMVMMAPGEWGPLLRSPLLSSGTKLRMLAETLLRPRERAGDVAAGEFVEDHFGREVVDYIAEPLLCGVYGGNARMLSAESVLPRFVGYERRYGSLIQGVRTESRIGTGQPLFLSFRDGMQQLTDALTGSIRENSRVVRAEATEVRKAARRWRIEAGEDSLTASHVVLACAAHVCGQLLGNTAPQLAGELDAIPYSSAILVTLVFDRHRLGHPLNGFGFLVPGKERRTITAATWTSTKFPSRVPSNLSALRAFIVGPQALELMSAGDETLIELVRKELLRLMGIDTAPLLSTVHKWPKSMPQYVVGHLDRVREIHEHVAQLEGLHVVGNAYEGVGIPDCVRLAKEAAQRISTRLQNSCC